MAEYEEYSVAGFVGGGMFRYVSNQTYVVISE